MANQISKESWDGYYNSYFFGEAKGAELISKLVDFAPGEAEKNWVKLWSMEEDHHHRLWAELAEKKKIEIKNMAGTTGNLFKITEDFVNAKDWVGSMVSAAIIEHISTAAAHYLYKHADDDTRRVFRKIISDDVGHLHFDLEQIEKAAATEEGRKKIMEVHKKFMKEILGWPMRNDLLEGEMEILNDAYELHRSKLAKMGVKLPSMKFSNSMSFKMRKALIAPFL